MTLCNLDIKSLKTTSSQSQCHENHTSYQVHSLHKLAVKSIILKIREDIILTWCWKDSSSLFWIRNGHICRDCTWQCGGRLCFQTASMVCFIPWRPKFKILENTCCSHGTGYKSQFTSFTTVLQIKKCCSCKHCPVTSPPCFYV